MGDSGPSFTYSYEREAMQGGEMPDGLELPDQLTFLALRSLYAQKRGGIIDRETGSREKAKLRYQRDTLCRKLGTKENMAIRSARFFRDVEHAANTYAKHRTLENADELYRTVYGLLPGKGREGNP